jgi:glycosyltransferase involved in cell wall biosynthesis
MVSMRILFVADGRSPIALNWIRTVIETGHEVHLVSTYPCQPEPGLASLHIIPVAGSSLAGGAGKNQAGVSSGSQLRPALRMLFPVWLRTWLRQRLGAVTLPAAARRLRLVIQQLQPELIHAMRIPYEGILAATALSDSDKLPLLVSVWGNDFTLHASSNNYLAGATRRTLQRADGLHADCQRDIRLGRIWGFMAERPAWVLPGGGGIHLEIFHQDHNQPRQPELVINPRGIRAYIRNDTFFQAIPLVLQKRPQVQFICPNMMGESQAESWVGSLGIADQVQLLPRQSSQQMAEWFRRSCVVVSPSTHDGTPNTLLEAMACGCFPIAGDIESLREWIVPGLNGLLFDPQDHQALAEQILLALEQPELLVRARLYNLQQVRERAEHAAVMQRAQAMYTSLVGK